MSLDEKSYGDSSLEIASLIASLKLLSSEEMVQYCLSDLKQALGNAMILMSDEAVDAVAVSIHAIRSGEIKKNSALCSLLDSIRSRCLSYKSLQLGHGVRGGYDGNEKLGEAAKNPNTQELLTAITGLHSLLPDVQPDHEEEIEPQPIQEKKRESWMASSRNRVLAAVVVIGAGVLALMHQRGENEKVTGDKVGQKAPADPEQAKKKASADSQEKNQEGLDKQAQANTPSNLQQPKQRIPTLPKHFGDTLKKPSAIHQPNIDTDELKEAGENENDTELVKETPIAEIISPSSSIDDSLWCTGSFQMDGKRNLVPVESLVFDFGKEVHGTAVLGGKQGLTIRAGQTIVLPRPVGFGAPSVTLDPPIRHTFYESTQTVQVAEDTDSVRITYPIHAVTHSHVKQPPEFSWDTPQPVQRSKGTLDVIASMKYASHEEGKDLLTRQLSSFTYITSKQLQMLLDLMPGSLEQKMEFIRYGDCDTLAMYILGVQRDAASQSLVHVGMQEEGNQLFPPPHPGHAVAQVGNRQFETTDKTSGSFEHVVFSDEDLDALLRTAKGMSGVTDDEELFREYQQFNDLLTTILKKDHYSKFSKKSSLSIESLLKGLKQAWNDAKHNLSDTFKKPSDHPMTSLFLALGALSLIIPALIGSLYAFIRALEIAHAKIYKRPLEYFYGKSTAENDRLAAQVFQKVSKDDPTIRINVSMDNIAQEVERLYETYPGIEAVIPKKDAMELPREKVLLLSKLMSIWPHFSDVLSSTGLPFGRIFTVLSVRQSMKKIALAFQQLLSRERISFDDVESVCREIICDPEELDRRRSAIPKRVENVMKTGVNVAATMKQKIKIPQSGGALASSRVGFPFGDAQGITPYQQGMDTRLLIKRFGVQDGDRMMAKEREPEAVIPTVDLIVALTESHGFDYSGEDLSILLHCLHQRRCEFTIDTITFLSGGTVLQHLPRSVVQNLLTHYPADSIRKLLAMKYEFELDHGIRSVSSRDHNIDLWYTPEFPSGAEELAAQSAAKKKRSIIVGMSPWEFQKLQSNYACAKLIRGKNTGVELVTPDTMRRSGYY